MPFGMKAVEALSVDSILNLIFPWSPMPFGMKAVEAWQHLRGIRHTRGSVTNAFRHEGR